MSDNMSIAKDFLVKLKDYALSIALVGYTSGFLITNIYLGKYGIANFDIVRAHYILSGIVFLLFAFTCLFPAYVSWKVYASVKENSIKNVISILRTTLTINLIAALFIFLPLLLVDNLEYGHQMQFAFPILSFCISFINSVFLVIAHYVIRFFFILPDKFRRLFYIDVGSVEDVASNASSFTIIPIILLSLILIIVFGYSLLVYPTLPQQLGGGREITVEVTYESPQIMKTLYMLDRTSNTIIFLEVDCTTKAKKTIEVASKDIFSISTVKSNPDQPVCTQSNLPATPFFNVLQSHLLFPQKQINIGEH